MIVVAGTMTIKPSELARFEQLLPAHMERTLAQNFCLMFALGVSNRATGLIAVAEAWKDEESLIRHHQQSFTKEFVAAFGGILGHDCRVYEVSQVRAVPSLESGANPA
jgi:quinol monooxygenase YgiN